MVTAGSAALAVSSAGEVTTVASEVIGEVIVIAEQDARERQSVDERDDGVTSAVCAGRLYKRSVLEQPTIPRNANKSSKRCGFAAINKLPTCGRYKS